MTKNIQKENVEQVRLLKDSIAKQKERNKALDAKITKKRAQI